MYNIIEEHYRNNYKELVRKYSNRIGRHNAEECIQEAYTRILEYTNRTKKEILDFDAFFHKCVNNICIDHMRKEKSRGMAEGEEEEIFVPSPEEDILIKIELEKVYKKIRIKKGKRRRILELYFLHDIDYEGIIKIMKVNYNYVIQEIWKFRKELKDE